MENGPELEINVDLYEALTEVLGTAPREPTPVVVLSAYLYALAKGYGLSDSNHLTESQLERADVPAPVMTLVGEVLGGTSAAIDGEALRDSLYAVVVELSHELRARRLLNKNEALSEVGLRRVAQIIWNLEATASRPLLPIQSGQTIDQSGKERKADIKVPGANKDFAILRWTERTNIGATDLGPGQAYKSSGQGLRSQGARLAVLAAERFLRHLAQPVSGMDGATMRVMATRGGSVKAVVSWPGLHEVDSNAHEAGRASLVGRGPRAHAGRVVVGRPPEVGKTYQRRSFDDEIDKIWADKGDRRVWLRGGPGRGKSFSARRVMEDAIADHREGREELLIWVNSADAVSVSAALSQAVDLMPQLHIGVDADHGDRVHRQAHAMLDQLATSGWRWLIVLDNADARSLIDSDLIPSGRNPNGRVLITTLSADVRIASRGEVVSAELFSPAEAEAFLNSSLGHASELIGASMTDRQALARAVGYHPLALSVATATITANRMDVAEWLGEFAIAERLDVVADAADPGGYPLGIGAIWQLALEKASQGMPSGVVKRAAAVAAVMDPDGHPTWLWGRDATATWIAGSAENLTRHHGRPVAVERLLEYGIVEFKGANWRDGLLAIHQLAVRAVSELLGEDVLSEITGILLDEMSGDNAPDERYFAPVDAMMKGLTRLLAIPAVLPSHRARGLLFLGELHSDMLDKNGALAAYEEAYDVALSVAHDAQDSALGLQVLALVGQGKALSSLGREFDATLVRGRALEIAQLMTEPGTDETVRAGLLAVGGVLRDLGRIDEAAEAFARWREVQPAEPESEDEERVEWLRSVGFVQALLGRRKKAERNLARALEISDHLKWDRRDSQVYRIAGALVPIQIELGKMRAAERTQLRLVEASGRLAKGGRLIGRIVHVAALHELAGMIEEDRQRQPEVTALYKRAVDAITELTETSPGQLEHAVQVKALMAQGWNHVRNDRHVEAADCFGQAAAIASTLADLTADNPTSSRAMRTARAIALFRQSDSQFASTAGEVTSSEGLRALRETAASAVEAFGQVTEEDPGEHDLELLYAQALGILGAVQSELDEPELARASVERAIASLTFLADIGGDEPGHGQVLHLLVADLVVLGWIQSGLGEDAEAAATYARLLDLAERAPDTSKQILALGLVRYAELADRLGFSQDVEDALYLALRRLQDPDPEE